MVYDPEGILGTMTSVVLCVLGVEVGFLSQTVYAIVIDTEWLSVEGHEGCEAEDRNEA